MRRIFRITAACLLAALLAPAMAAEPMPDTTSPRAAHGDVELVQTIDTQGFGTFTGLRLGDLTGDGQLDFAVAQHEDQDITCITALNADGDLLWREGEPHPDRYSTGFDLPIQIHDFTGDGASEVVYIANGQIRVLDGATGELKREGELPADNANDCIAFADLTGRGRAGEVLVKDRYSQIWALDDEFDVLWTYSRGHTVGHYPWPHDLTGDGHDEVLIGPSTLDHQGELLWLAEEGFPEDRHSDGTTVADLTGDGNPEVIIPACNPELLVYNAEGKLLWMDEIRHAQHAIAGDFRPDLPGQEVAVLDRDTDRSAEGEDAIIVYDHEGNVIWHEERTDEGVNRWLSVITMVSDWDDEEGDLILGYRRGGTTQPTLYDGHGEPVAVFPFPENPEEQHLAQHGDIYRDGREEVVVWNENEIRIFTNAALEAEEQDAPREPNELLYNYTHYIGMP